MITIVKMLKNGNVVGYGRNEDVDAAKNDAIRDYYVNGNHDLTHDELWDMIDNDKFEFITQIEN
jgi:hypothetical protein